MTTKQTPLVRQAAEALALLIGYIPSCGALAESGIRVSGWPWPDEEVWWVDAGSDAHDCGWRIETVEEGLQFLHDHYSLVVDHDDDWRRGRRRRGDGTIN